MLKYLFTLLFIIPINSYAQPGYIKIIAGNGGASYSGDGGAATSAAISWPKGIATDPWGNTYIHDGGNGRIRKVAPDGIITTVAGGGTSTADGILAVNASLFAMPMPGFSGAVAIDHSGNIILIDGGLIRKVTASTGIITTIATMDATDLYIDAADNIYVANGIYIRKITPAGVVSIVAGVSTGGFSGDGGPATAARLNGAAGICGDAAGNLYISDKGNSRIRKINSAGIISTIAGTGVAGFSGDGGPATAAAMKGPLHLRMDSHSNLFFVDSENDRIRKISPAGIISTVVGGGGSTPTVSGIPANNSHILLPSGIGIDASDNLYVTDQGQEYAHKLDYVGGMPTVASDSFSAYASSTCANVEFTITPATFSSGLTVKTWFGDGDVQTNSFTYSGNAWFTHTYACQGTYLIKHVLYNGTLPIDSATYSHTYQFCRTLPLKLFVDNNSNCAYDNGTDVPFFLPIAFSVDSAGVPIDTVPCTSSLSYNAAGPVGTIYTFRPLSVPPGVVVACPSSGVLTHTLTSTSGSAPVYLGLRCSSASGYDLRLHTSFRAGVHYFGGTIMASNLYCSPPAATITMHLSPKYTNDLRFYPSPTSISGTTVKWNVNTLSSVLSTPFVIHAGMEKTSGVLLPFGDTVITGYSITPATSDANPSDNMIIRTDSVESGYDPNDISVSPQGCLTNQTHLTYTIRFENTGNAPAYNIYVLDTLPAEVDVKSMRIEAASHIMNTYIKKSGAMNIVRFEFPDINLPDSSHHGQNSGMVVYSINRYSWLTDGTHIRNRVGIYFDDNPPILTNTAENTIGCPIAAVTEVAQLTKAQVHPNPAANELIVNAQAGEFTHCVITNSIGQTLLSAPITGSTTSMDVKNLPAGIYYLTLRGAHTEVHKVVKL